MEEERDEKKNKKIYIYIKGKLSNESMNDCKEINKDMNESTNKIET